MTKTKRKYAVVDLEATSAGTNATIIQVGIVIIENGKITDTFETDVNPHEKLDDHIIHLTGITDEQLVQAPDFGQVAYKIYSLIEDCIFVAHNVKFDANLLAEQLFFEGYELRTPRVDTVELAQVFYPTLEKYNLGALANALDLDLEDAHTAIADAQATAQLFLKMTDKMKHLPKELLERLLDFADNLLFESRLVLEEAYAEADLMDVADYVEWQGLILRKQREPLPTRKLSTDFALNMGLLGMDARNQQSQFADLVEQVYDQPETSFLQAQAGLGKTYGYLLPLLAMSQDEQIIVSVPTKILQDQIMANEVKKIEDVFHISATSLKGPANYIKLDAFYASLQQEDSNRLVNRYKMQLLVWLTETETGDLDEIKQKQRFAAYFDQIKHDGDLEVSSLFADLDFWQRRYDLASQSKLLLTNHAYFLERVQDDKAFAKDKVLVFDEAQKLVLTLESFSRGQLNLTQDLQTMGKLLTSPLPLLQRRLLENLSFELSHLAENFYQNGLAQINSDHMDRLRNSVQALEVPGLEKMEEFFALAFTDFWFETEQSADKRLTLLKGAREDLLDFQAFLPETRKTYMISATLDISPQVNLPDLLGFDQISYGRIPHHINLNQKIWVDKTMPDVSILSSEDYAFEIAQRLTDLRELGQPILVLFTAKQAMFAVSDLLERAEVKHLTQEKNGTAYNIKKRFDRGETSLLLGTGAFWEGVDFVNADRMIAVVTRIPFNNPKDMFVQKLNQYLSLQGKNAFYDYSLPIAILKLKQAIGRTMRRDGQKSAVLILDSRILSKHYGPVISQALEEEFQLSYEKFSSSLTEMAEFLL